MEVIALLLFRFEECERVLCKSVKSVIALGYPTEDITARRESRYEENRVHFNKW